MMWDFALSIVTMQASGLMLDCVCAARIEKAVMALGAFAADEDAAPVIAASSCIALLAEILVGTCPMS